MENQEEAAQALAKVMNMSDVPKANELAKRLIRLMQCSEFERHQARAIVKEELSQTVSETLDCIA